jgi:sulfide:quinone oxidoreductase
MDIKELTANLSVSPQILGTEIESIAKAGFKTIICNRPDGEGQIGRASCRERV